jgi:hypothetical protein
MDVNEATVMNLPSDLVTEQMQLKVERPEHARAIADIVAALSTIEGLIGLTEEEFTWLATHGTQRYGKDGDLIFSHGSPPEHLMFILHFIKPSVCVDRPDRPDYGQNPFFAHQGMDRGRTLIWRHVDSRVA